MRKVHQQKPDTKAVQKEKMKIPEPYPLDSLTIKNIDLEILKINDVVLSIKKEKGKKSLTYSILITMLIASGLGFFGAMSLENSSEDLFLVFCQIVMGLSFTVSICLMIYTLFNNLRNNDSYECEFNRIKGTVTYGKNALNPHKKVVLFQDCKIDFGDTSVIVHHTRVHRRKDLHLDLVYAKEGRKDRILSFYPTKKSADNKTDIMKAYSFLMWYMDSNRPLPAGKILDPYRQQDSDRRK